MARLLTLGAGGMSAAPVFSPLDISNLKAWYKADAGVTLNGPTVSQWDDYSGNARHLKQTTAANQPTYLTNTINGLPSIDFDGVNDYLLTDATLNTGDAMTMFCVFKKESASSQGIITGGSGAYQFLQYGSAFYIGGAQKVNTMTTDLWYIRSGTRTTAGALAEHFSNGSSLGTTAGGGTEHSLFRYVGTYNFQAANYTDGKIAEILIYQGVLTGAQMTEIHNYLNSKYAIY